MPTKPVEDVVLGCLFTFSPPTRVSQFSKQTAKDNRANPMPSLLNYSAYLDLLHGQFSLPISLNWGWKYAQNFCDLYVMQIYILHASMSDNTFWLERFKIYCTITLAFWFVILIFLQEMKITMPSSGRVLHHCTEVWLTSFWSGWTINLSDGWILAVCIFFCDDFTLQLPVFWSNLDPTTYPKILLAR